MPSFDLTLSPAQIEFIAKPGATLTQAYQLTNNSDSTVFLTPSVELWLPQGPDGQVNYTAVPPASNLNFSLLNRDYQLNQSFSLAPGASTQLVLVVKSDTDTPLADTYATFFISQNQGLTTAPSTSARIGSHLLISTSATANPAYKSQIVNLKIAPTLKDIFFTPLSISGQIKNESDYFFATQGEITISKNDLVIQKLTLFPHNVLAHHSRTLACLDQNQPVPCRLQPPFWPGKYTATVSLDPTLHATPLSLSFFVLPYSFLLLTLGLTLIILAIFRLLRQSDKK